MGQENNGQENNRQGEAFQPAKWIFPGALLVAVILYFSVSILSSLAKPDPETTQTLLPTLNATSTPPKFDPIQTVVPPNETPTSYQVTKIIVGDWQIERSKCVNITRSWVKLLGVEITGGIPPYKISIEQKNILIYEGVANILPESQPSKIIFSSPITVNTGSFINVTINSSTNEEKLRWQDRLFFHYYDPMCLGDEE